MRRAADRVDEQMRDYMESRDILWPWPAGERLMVCVSSSPLGERLVRSARRLADGLKAEWFAVYVETPQDSRLSPEKRRWITRTLNLAEQLGAKVVTIPGESVAATAIEYARAHNITKIIAGKPVRSPWREALHGSVADKLIHSSGNIDVYVISSIPESPKQGENKEGWQIHRPWRRYLFSPVLVGAATALGYLGQMFIHPVNLVMIYLVAVVSAAIYLGRGPAILTSILSVLAFDFFFVPPHFNARVSDSQYLLTFAGLLVVGLVISGLASQVRGQIEAGRRRETESATLVCPQSGFGCCDGT